MRARTGTAPTLPWSVVSLLLLSNGAEVYAANGQAIDWVLRILGIGCTFLLPGTWLTRKRWLIFLNALTLGYLMFGIGQFVTMNAEPLNLASSFLLVLLANKLLGPRLPKDCLQLLILSLLQMVVSTARTSRFELGIALILFIALLPVCLQELHKRQHDEIFQKGTAKLIALDPQSSSESISDTLSPFLMSILVVTGATLFFIFTPRIGLGLLVPDVEQSAMTGFSGQVELGTFGRIRNNPKTVLRAKIPLDQLSQLNGLYWRGISLDHYMNGKWAKSFHNRIDVPFNSYRPHSKSQKQAHLIFQEIVLEPMNAKVVFGLGRLSKLSKCPDDITTTRKLSFSKDVVGDHFYDTKKAQAIRYCALTQIEKSTADDEALSRELYEQRMGQISERFTRTYRQVPATDVVVLEQVLAQIQPSTSGVLASVEKVKTFLESNYRYTLDRPAQKDPSALKDFLVDQKEGHCEYFATAMVLLLRQMGIAARIVNGFSGGKRNRFDDFIAIRQSNAHSWVEVFMPTKQCDGNDECAIVGNWLTIDPTPSSEMSRLGSSVTRDFVDAIQLKWNQYVIRYNLNTQLSWVKGVFEWLTPTPPKALRTSTSKQSPSTTPKEDSSSMSVFWLLILTLLGGLVGLWLRRKRRDSRLNHSNSLQLLINHFTQADLDIRPDETLREWVKRIESVRGSSPQLEAWLKEYEKYRYNRVQVEPNKLSESALKVIHDDERKRAGNDNFDV